MACRPTSAGPTSSQVGDIALNVAFAGTDESTNGRVEVPPCDNCLLVAVVFQQALATYPSVTGEFCAEAIDL